MTTSAIAIITAATRTRLREMIYATMDKVTLNTVRLTTTETPPPSSSDTMPDTHVPHLSPSQCSNLTMEHLPPPRRPVELLARATAARTMVTPMLASRVFSLRLTAQGR